MMVGNDGVVMLLMVMMIDWWWFMMEMGGFVRLLSQYTRVCRRLFDHSISVIILYIAITSQQQS